MQINRLLTIFGTVGMLLLFGGYFILLSSFMRFEREAYVDSKTLQLDSESTHFADTDSKLDTPFFTNWTQEERKRYLDSIAHDFTSDRLKILIDSKSDEEATRRMANLRMLLRPKVEVQFLAEILSYELESTNRDWRTIFNCFLAASAGVHDARFYKFVEQVLLEEKPKDLPFDQGRAILIAINLLAFLDTEECPDLLLRCTRSSFWRDMDLSTKNWDANQRFEPQITALEAISRLKRHLSIPMLESFVKQQNIVVQQLNFHKDDTLPIHKSLLEQQDIQALLENFDHESRLLDVAKYRLNKLKKLPNDEYSRYYEVHINLSE